MIYANHEKLRSFYKTPACIAIIRYPSYSFTFSLFLELRLIIFCVSLSFFNILSFSSFMFSLKVSFFIDFIRPTISVFTFISFYISYSCSFIIDSILLTFSLLFKTFLCKSSTLVYKSSFYFFCSFTLFFKSTISFFNCEFI